jgi:hypothetical protein
VRFVTETFENEPSNILFNLTYLAVTTLAFARLAPTKTQVNRALGGPCGRSFLWCYFFGDCMSFGEFRKTFDLIEQKDARRTLWQISFLIHGFCSTGH